MVLRIHLHITYIPIFPDIVRYIQPYTLPRVAPKRRKEVLDKLKGVLATDLYPLWVLISYSAKNNILEDYVYLISTRSRHLSTSFRPDLDSISTFVAIISTKSRLNLDISRSYLDLISTKSCLNRDISRPNLDQISTQSRHLSTLSRLILAGSRHFSA